MSENESEPRYPRVHVQAASEEEEEQIAALLWELGATGVETRDANTLDGPEEGASATLVGHFELVEEAEEAILALAPRYAVRLEFLVGDAWREGWKAFFKPALLADRIWVRPPWEPSLRQEGQIEIVIDPGQAFGTGTHETTRLVLATLADEVRGGERVLDLGCGSGILAIGALLLGAEEAQGLDIDVESVRATLENAEVNGVAERLRAAQGELSSLEEGESFDLILANIRGPILEPLAPALWARLRPGGTLILSGILREEEEALRAAYGPLGPVAVRADGDWISLRVGPRG